MSDHLTRKKIVFLIGAWVLAGLIFWAHEEEKIGVLMTQSEISEMMKAQDAERRPDKVLTWDQTDPHVKYEIHVTNSKKPPAHESYLDTIKLETPFPRATCKEMDVCFKDRWIHIRAVSLRNGLKSKFTTMHWEKEG